MTCSFLRRGSRIVQEVAHAFAQWVPRFDNSLGWEPSRQTWQPCAYPVDAIRENSIGDAGKTVLLLNQCRKAFSCRLVQQRSTGEATDTHHDLRFVVAQQTTRFDEAAEKFKGKRQVSGAGQFSFKSADPKSVDVVACGGNFFHLHPSHGPYESDVGLRVATLDLVSDGKGGVDVSSSASTGNHDVLDAPHQVSEFPLEDVPACMGSCWTTRVTASIMPSDRHVNRSEVPP